MSSVTRIAVSQFFQYCNLHPCLSCLLYRDLPAEIIVNSSVSKIKYDHSLPYFKAAKKCFCIILQCNNFDLLVKIANFFIILSCFTFLDMLPLSLIQEFLSYGQQDKVTGPCMQSCFHICTAHSRAELHIEIQMSDSLSSASKWILTCQLSSIKTV